MILAASALDDDPEGMAMLAGLFRPASTDQHSTIEQLRVQRARPAARVTANPSAMESSPHGLQSGRLRKALAHAE
jgi:hypothetical protein